MGMNNLSHAFENEFTKDNFKQVLESLSEIHARFGIGLPPYSDPSLVWYGQLSQLEQKSAFNMANTYHGICQSIESDGASLRDNRVFLWRGLKELGLNFDNDLFDRITEDDLIEVYNSQNIGLFRNLKFYDFISYPMEDIYCRPWTDLFTRPDLEKSMKLVEAAESVFNKNGQTVNTKSLGFHRVIETDSPERLKMDVLVKELHPLFDQNQKVSALVAVEHSISKGSVLEEEDGLQKDSTLPSPPQMTLV